MRKSFVPPSIQFNSILLSTLKTEDIPLHPSSYYHHHPISSAPLLFPPVIETISVKMMSLRAVARSAPRTLTRMSAAAVRNTRAAQPSSLLRTAWAPLPAPRLAATFSSTSWRQAKKTEVDEELLTKLESELQFENEMKETTQLPSSVKDFLESSPYELKDEPGREDVYLHRKFNDET